MMSPGPLARIQVWTLYLLTAAGCVTVIRPPASPEDPVTVAVVDHGYHSSLLLPSPEGGSVEYGFGEWDWFALNRDAWINVFGTLCWPNQGALGRRLHAAPPAQVARAGALQCEEMLEVEVARAKASALQRRLEESFQARIETRVTNPLLGLDLVHSDDDYCFLVNCNHMLGRWLRELGCELGGTATFSSFRVERAVK